MKFMIRPIAVKPLRRYKIWVKFSDGVEGIADLSHLAGKGVFACWEQGDYFERVYVDEERGAVAWDKGIDLCPDSLYMEITGKTVKEIFPSFAATSHA